VLFEQLIVLSKPSADSFAVGRRQKSSWNV
jgi:hypothetical protein